MAWPETVKTYLHFAFDGNRNLLCMTLQNFYVDSHVDKNFYLEWYKVESLPISIEIYEAEVSRVHGYQSVCSDLLGMEYTDYLRDTRDGDKHILWQIYGLMVQNTPCLLTKSSES
jgi:hypothetical protein